VSDNAQRGHYERLDRVPPAHERGGITGGPWTPEEVVAGKHKRPDDLRCRNVLHIDWEADPVPVREDVARCVLDAPHEGKRHQGKDEHGSWFRW
jgi:hypothetical protein